MRTAQQHLIISDQLTFAEFANSWKMAYFVMPAAVVAAVVNRRPLRRNANLRREPYSSEEDIRAAVRLTEAEIGLLSVEYNQWRSLQSGIAARNEQSAQRMLEFLAYLARGGYYHQIALPAGVAKSTVILHVHDVAQFFASTAQQFIALPQPNEFPALTSPLHTANQQHRVILYVDGFIVKIQRPDHAGDAYFCGRHGKTCDSINVQYVTDRFGRIRHVVTGLSGATHDKTAISWSANFMAFLNALPPEYVVLGDPAYRGLHPQVITTFSGGNLTAAQLQFNDDCTRLRQVGLHYNCKHI